MRFVVRGPDWYISDNGKIIMNYGGYNSQLPNWEPWQEKFCWVPTQIKITVFLQDSPYRNSYTVSKWVWWRTIYVRRKLTLNPLHNKKYDYEYAEDMFDLIKQEFK